MQSGPPSQDDFDRLMAEVEAPPEDHGSGWFDLWSRVRHWGYQSGLSVPDDHPWRIPRDTFRCTDPSAYEGHITLGKTYRASAAILIGDCSDWSMTAGRRAGIRRPVLTR